MIGGEKAGATALAGARARAGIPRKRMLLISNPRATGVSAGLTQAVLEGLDRRYRIDLVEPDVAGAATRLSRDAATDGYEIVTVLGGDGTMNCAANGLVGTETPLACLPGGRTNVFARALGLPEDAIGAAERLMPAAADPRTRRVDTGLVNGRHFVFASSVGFGATANARVDRRPRLKARLGEYYFAYETLASVARGRSSPVRVTAGGRSVEGVTAIVQNCDPLTYFGRRPVRVCEHAGFTTGTLSLAVLKRASLGEVLVLPPRAILAGRPPVTSHPQVESLPRVASASVEALAGERFPVEVDGDYIGELDHVEYGIAPRSLSILG